jgi:hypothetical protein
MACRQDIFTLVGKRIQAPRTARADYEGPALADLIARIDRAVRDRRAA